MTISLELLTDRRCPFDRSEGAACPGSSACVGRATFVGNDPVLPAAV
ncbi:hypothetical protein [Cryptosporangium japonicum]|uniref:Uncharacterized protein n=1 Tax=Cryptosporangium japonicum TaxID=80872 RepID=A0ABP3DAW0_9ACTN